MIDPNHAVPEFRLSLLCFLPPGVCLHCCLNRLFGPTDSSCLFTSLHQVLLLLRGYLLKNRLHLFHVTRPGVLLYRPGCGFTEAATQVRVATELLDDVCELPCISRLLQDKAIYAV